MTYYPATKGPWAYDFRTPHGSAEGQFEVIDPASDNGDTLAVVDPDCTRHDLEESAEANARLMAASPDLLDACKAMLLHRECPVNSPEAEAMRGAIAKAEGR